MAKNGYLAYLNDDLVPDPAQIAHERGRLHHVRLTDDEMNAAMRIRHETRELIDYAAVQHRISEYLAKRLNAMHVENESLLRRIKERECIRVLDITIDDTFKIVEAKV